MKSQAGSDSGETSAVAGGIPKQGLESRALGWGKASTRSYLAKCTTHLRTYRGGKKERGSVPSSGQKREKEGN